MSGGSGKDDPGAAPRQTAPAPAPTPAQQPSLPIAVPLLNPLQGPLARHPRGSTPSLSPSSDLTDAAFAQSSLGSSFPSLSLAAPPSLPLSALDSLEDGAGRMDLDGAESVPRHVTADVVADSLRRKAAEAAPTTPEGSLLAESEAPGEAQAKAKPSSAAGARAAPASSAPSKDKPASTRAERRALQEAQRAAKEAAKSGGGGAKPALKGPKGPSAGAPASSGAGPAGQKGPQEKAKKGPPTSSAESGSRITHSSGAALVRSDAEKPAPASKPASAASKARGWQQVMAEEASVPGDLQVDMLRHLPQYDREAQIRVLEERYFAREPTASAQVHPAMYQLGISMLRDPPLEGPSRCLALLGALKALVAEYSTPPEKTLSRDLTARIGANVSFIIACRPLSVAMGNVIRLLKARLAALGTSNVDEATSKAVLIQQLEKLAQERIVYAGHEIVSHACQRLKGGQSRFLTLSFSSTVLRICTALHAEGSPVHVHVADAAPARRGQEMVRQLLGEGVSATYLSLNAVPHALKAVSHVLLEASAVLANGAALAPAGTAAVAMAAHAVQVPVLVCCESLGFSERVQLDSLTWNEIGNPDDVLRSQPGKPQTEPWRESKHLRPLNLLYDVTPAEYVTAVLTELGMVPPTGVPAILREHRKDSLLL